MSYLIVLYLLGASGLTQLTNDSSPGTV